MREAKPANLIAILCLDALLLAEQLQDIRDIRRMLLETTQE